MKAAVAGPAAAAALAIAMLLPAGLTAARAETADASAKKPAKCKKGSVTVKTGKKRTCMTHGQLSRGVPSGATFAEATAALTFVKGLWRGGGRKAVAEPLGKDAPSFVQFDLALVGTSQRVGKPLVPDSPTRPSRKAAGG